MTLETIVFGDPHCDFTAIEEAAYDIDPLNPPLCIFLGDFGFGDKVVKGSTILRDGRSPDEILAPLTDLGCRILYILGNHDFDNEDQYLPIRNSTVMRVGNLNRSVVEIDGVRIAGLGGIFGGRVWNTKAWERGEPDAMKYRTRAEFALAKKSRWMDGLAVPHRAFIFPEDIDHMRDLRADILVTHEAPYSEVASETGHQVLGRLAEEMGVKAIIHGHLHHAYETELESGIAVIGRGKSDFVKMDLRQYAHDLAYAA